MGEGKRFYPIQPVPSLNAIPYPPAEKRPQRPVEAALALQSERQLVRYQERMEEF